MSSKRYTAEFKAEAVKQVVERGHSVADTAARLGINKHSLYDWVKRTKQGPLAASDTAGGDETAELRSCDACAPSSSGSPKSVTS